MKKLRYICASVGLCAAVTLVGAGVASAALSGCSASPANGGQQTYSQCLYGSGHQQAVQYCLTTAGGFWQWGGVVGSKQYEPSHYGSVTPSCGAGTVTSRGYAPLP